MTFEDLYNVILEQKRTRPKNSYVASLMEKGEDRILQKVGEEAVEVIIAAKGQGKQRIVEETTDLIFHLFVMLAKYDISLEDIVSEIEMRRAKKKGV